jgi:putative tryptophan/tyrosine transport system substrate-binding protein
MKRLALIAVWGLAAASAQAGGIVAVLSSDTAPYKEALEGLKAAAGPVDSAVLPALPDVSGASVIVTFGGEAALKKYPAAAALVAALLPDPKLKPQHDGALTRVALLPDPAVLLGKIKALNPGVSSLAVFDVGGAYSDYLNNMKAAGAGIGIAVNIKRIDSIADLAGKLPGLKGTVQALWLPPDPLVMNQATFSLLSTFCSAAKIALVAPVAALARAGAFAGISPSFSDVGKAAGKAALAYTGGANPGELVYPSHVQTVLNTNVAALIGVNAAGAKAKADSVVP